MTLRAAYLGYFIYTLIDDGVANVLAVHTLRHGTNPIDNIRIRCFGGDPAHGGKPSGSTGSVAFIDTAADCKGRFYLFKDTVDFAENNWSNNQLNYRLCPRNHVYHSSNHFAISRLPKGPVSAALAYIFAAISANLVPTLKFRYSKIDAYFKNDSSYCFNEKKVRLFYTERSPSVYITRKVEAWRLGMVGSLLTGLNSNWLSRAKAKPNKIFSGVVQLTAAVALTTFYLSELKKAPIATALGMILA